jgi:histidine triad (HIT) family protein
MDYDFSEDCLFCKIANGEVPADIVYQDDDILAFKDINPQAPVHILIIPKKHIDNAYALKPEDDAIVAKIFRLCAKISDKFGLGDGYRIVTNSGKHAKQSVYHLHFHLLGGDYLITSVGVPDDKKKSKPI